LHREHDRRAAWLLTPLAAACLLTLVRTLLTIVRRIPLNFNEGWNAYHTADLTAGRPLYPDLAGAFFNNYPPLSFYVVAPLGRALGDQMLAGRLLAFVSLIAWTAFVVAAARRLRCSWPSAIFGGLVLAVWMFVFSSVYVGVNDPQIFGHALQLLGLVLLLRERRITASLAAGAVLLAAGVFVKANLIALPIAAVLWMWTDDRSSAWRLIAYGALAGVAGVAMCFAAFGPQFVAQLLSPRAYVPAKAALMSWQWLRRMILPLAAVIWLAGRSRDDRGARFVLAYTTTSVAVGLLFAGGEGVYWNTMFDADCALALAAAVAIDRAPNRVAVVAAFLAVPALVIGTSATTHWLSPRFWFDPRWSEATTAAADVEFVRRHAGPALCEDMVLCYWADKPVEVDVFNTRQRSRHEWWRVETLIRRLEARDFGVAAIDDDDRSLGPQFMDALRRNYRVDHSSQWGVFWVPK
jgi:hypothetical protein